MGECINRRITLSVDNNVGLSFEPEKRCQFESYKSTLTKKHKIYIPSVFILAWNVDSGDFQIAKKVPNLLLGDVVWQVGQFRREWWFAGQLESVFFYFDQKTPFYLCDVNFESGCFWCRGQLNGVTVNIDRICRFAEKFTETELSSTFPAFLPHATLQTNLKKKRKINNFFAVLFKSKSIEERTNYYR